MLDAGNTRLLNPKTFRGLCLVGLCLALICLARFALVGERIPAGVEVETRGSSETALSWAPSTSGKYFIFLRCDVASLPSEVKDNLFNPSHPARVVWKADFNVATNGVPLITKTELNCEAAIRSGQNELFLIAECELRASQRIDISLVPKETFPFGPSSPWLTVRPNDLDYEAYRMRWLFWTIASVFCIITVITLLFVGLLRGHPEPQSERAES
jgi:hypothetical protein